MKFQRRILPPHSPTYLEMEEYTTPSSSRQSISFTGSTSDLSEVGSVYSLSTTPRQRSDSLNNLFNMSEDNTSVSNLSLASFSISQYSCDNGSYTNATIYTTVSPVTMSSSPLPPTPTQQHHQQLINSVNNGSDKISRKQYSCSYRSLTEEQSSPVNNRKSNSNNNSRRSGDGARHYHFGSSNISTTSSTTSSQRSFPIKTAESVLSTIGLNKSSSNDDITDKCGLIAHDANDIEHNDDDSNNANNNNNNLNLNSQHQHNDITHFSDSHYVDSSDENELDMTLSRNSSGTTQAGRGFRKTVLSNVDRLLNSGSKQIKL